MSIQLRTLSNRTVCDGIHLWLVHARTVQEPVAFFGGLVAGLLRLDLQEEPLRDWVQRTSKAAGVDEPTSSAGISDGEIQLDDDDDAATEIDIE